MGSESRKNKPQERVTSVLKTLLLTRIFTICTIKRMRRNKFTEVLKIKILHQILLSTHDWFPISCSHWLCTCGTTWRVHKYPRHCTAECRQLLTWCMTSTGTLQAPAWLLAHEAQKAKGCNNKCNAGVNENHQVLPTEDEGILGAETVHC